MEKLQKTNVMRLLDTKKIPYETRTFDVTEEHKPGTWVADTVGLPYERVYKTLVLKDDKLKPFVCVIPCDAELDLKKVAKASGHKSVTMLPLAELTATTGYIRGGCSPLGMKKLFPTFVEERALAQETIAVSAGVRTAQVILAPQDLLRLVNAKPAQLCQ